MLADRENRAALGLGRGLFILALALAVLTGRPAEAGYSSILLDASTGEVLSDMNADITNYPASLTKVMTLYVTFEALKSGRITLDTVLPVSDWAASQAPSKLGLAPGYGITVQDAILGVVTKSANDAATALAEGVGESESTFVDKMNAAAQKLGMGSTVFRNASGLPDPDQVTTARDMSTLAVAVLRDFPEYYHFFGTPYFNYEGHVFENHNRMLKTYKGADGLKTGYIRASGFNLVASAERDGRRLIGVVMGSQSPAARNAQMAQLLNAGFKNETTRLAALSGQTKPTPIKLTSKATAKTAAKPAGPDRSFGIQVGAFSRFAPAHLAATRAVRNAPRLLAHTKVTVDTVAGDATIVYRARVMGLNEDRARKVCAVLAAKKMDCLTVGSDGNVNSATSDEGDTADQSER